MGQRQKVECACAYRTQNLCPQCKQMTLEFKEITMMID